MKFFWLVHSSFTPHSLEFLQYFKTARASCISVDWGAPKPPRLHGSNMTLCFSLQGLHQQPRPRERCLAASPQGHVPHRQSEWFLNVNQTIWQSCLKPVTASTWKKDRGSQSPAYSRPLDFLSLHTPITRAQQLRLILSQGFQTFHSFCFKGFQNFTWLPLPPHSGLSQIASFQQGLACHPQECCTLFFHTTPYRVPTLSSPWHLSILKWSCWLFLFSSLPIELLTSRMSALVTAVSSIRGSPGTW